MTSPSFAFVATARVEPAAELDDDDPVELVGVDDEDFDDDDELELDDAVSDDELHAPMTTTAARTKGAIRFMPLFYGRRRRRDCGPLSGGGGPPGRGGDQAEAHEHDPAPLAPRAAAIGAG